jgi:hypothetical protein
MACDRIDWCAPGVGNGLDHIFDVMREIELVTGVVDEQGLGRYRCQRRVDVSFEA